MPGKSKSTGLPRVDFSELVDALQMGDAQKADQLLKEIMPRLEDYLKVVMGADRNDAQECAQLACIEVVERIKKDKIKQPKYIFKYLIFSTRNQYLHHVKRENRYVSDPDGDYSFVEPAQQIESLVEEERIEILKQCIEDLRHDNQEFILYVMNNPDKTTTELSKHFKMSYAYVRTKKSRLVNKLHHCFKRKSSDM